VLSMSFKNKNVCIWLVVLISFHTNYFASEILRKNLFKISSSLSFTCLTLFFFARHHTSIEGDDDENQYQKNNFIDLIIKADFAIRDDFFTLLQNDESLQKNFLQIPIMLYANKTLSKEKLENISHSLMKSIPYLSDDIVLKIFKSMWHYNKMFMDNDSRVSFGDHLAILAVLLNQGININKVIQRDTNFIQYKNDRIDEEILSTMQLFLNHGLFIKKNTLDVLCDESLTIFQPCINNESLVFKYLDQTTHKSDGKDLIVLCDMLCKSSQRPMIWLLDFTVQYEIPFNRSIDIFTKMMTTFFKKIDQKKDKEYKLFYIKDLQLIFDYITNGIENILLESKAIAASKFSDALGIICNEIVSFGYHQDESNYSYFKPLLVGFVKNSNKDCKPNLSMKDDEGTMVQKLARYVFDDEIMNLVIDHYDKPMLKQVLEEKKEHISFNNELVSCFDIAKLSEDNQTKEIFNDLRRSIL